MRKTAENIRLSKTSSVAQRLRRFCRSENGSWTIEAVIWTPIYLMLTAVAVNVSLVFHNESKVLHVMQNVTRAHSLGRYGENAAGDAAALEALNAQLAFFNAPYQASVAINGPLVRVAVSYDPVDLMTMGFLTAPFDGFTMNLVTEQLEEL